MITGWMLSDVARMVNGLLVGDGAAPISGITTDSRTVRPGELFVAIEGDTYDGHDFAAEAVRQGACAALVRRRGAEVAPRIEVDDTLDALLDLAAARRGAMDVPVIGVTGSTGKTTTKDLLAAALPGAWVSPRSYNNEVGVPLSVLGAPADARYLVLEVGSRGVGHIASLLPAVLPDVAVITNLGLVHLETFGTEEALAAAKWELVDGLGPGGTAVLPVDEPRLARSHRGRTVTFGVERPADVTAVDVEVDGSGLASFTLVAGEERARVRLPLPGRHQAANAAAATAAGLAVGVDLGTLAAGLARAEGSPWRMEVHRGRFTVVNDSYNANPDSVEAALRTVAGLPGRHIAVLGRMAVLGPVTEREHLRMGALASNLGYAVVLTVGDDPGIARGADAIARAVPDVEAAAAALAELVHAGDVVLVKGSRAVGLETLAARLTEEALA